MKRTVAEINERIKKGQAVVLTAEEIPLAKVPPGTTVPFLPPAK